MTASTGWPRRTGSSSRASSCSRAQINSCRDHDLSILSWLNKSFVLNFQFLFFTNVLTSLLALTFWGFPAFSKNIAGIQMIGDANNSRTPLLINY
jgi:hypothetical protein